MTMLLMVRGDTFTYTATIGSPTPVNLTGCTLWFTIKPAIVIDPSLSDPTDATDATALVKNSWTASGTPPAVGITVATPSSGAAVVTIAPTVTATFSANQNYLFDLQLQDAAGAITTIDSGAISVAADVTRRLSLP